MMLYQRTLRPLFFAMPPSWAHHLAMLTMWPIEHWLWLRRIVARLLRVPGPRVHTMGLTFASPVGLAGGFDKDGRRPQALAALGFGFLELGTVTAMPQAENPPPNLFRLPEDRALINRLGFPNDGAHRLAARLLTIGGRGALPVPVGISIGKSRAVPVESLSEVVADYVSSFVAVRDVADYIVVNISSPNTANLRSMQAAAPARALLTALREVNQSSGKALPILVKLSPDLDDEALAGILQVVTDLQLQGVVATNTTITRPRLLTPAPQVQAAGGGWPQRSAAAYPRARHGAPSPQQARPRCHHHGRRRH